MVLTKLTGGRFNAGTVTVKEWTILYNIILSTAQRTRGNSGIDIFDSYYTLALVMATINPSVHASTQKPPTSVRSTDTPKTPRKKPHCTQCGHPMKGHRRSRCSGVYPAVSPRTTDTSPINAPKPKTTEHEPRSTNTDVNAMSLALATLDISMSRRDHDPPTDIEDTEEETQASSKRIPPTSISSSPGSTLRRTNSYDIWSAFAKQYGLDETKAAHVIPIEAGKVRNVESAAQKQGFATRVVHLTDSKIGCLIVGKQREAVDQLWDSVSHHHRPSFTVVSASAALGALAAWAVLAFA
ncbi:hypothetical protein CERSUDRAFT_121255 [Gelatoporia subvermispora B]|uniref:Uncharacterized protein n=1 Tax=Ceriporiopsis subvermispora (strain B) TaxID=914234 RepID=M2QTX9_CERS8|nr:hypothetical protein CERSUDRAFT_121255 [Gelatoporia subvermispora B]